MALFRALKSAFSWNPRALYGGAVLYLAGLLFSTAAMAPFRAALHARLDASPAAAGLLKGDLSLFLELFMSEKGMDAAAFGGLLPLLLLFVPVVLFLQGAIYVQAVQEQREGKFWRPFLDGGARAFLPFLGLVLLNLVLYLLAAVLPALGIVGLARGLKEAEDPRVDVLLLLLGGIVGGLLFVLARNGAGFARARRALLPEGEPLGRAFLRSTAFTFRRFLPVTGLGLFFVLARWIWLWLFAFVLSPGTASPVGAAATVLLLQAGFAGTALLRVAEARAQVAYLRPFVEAEAPKATETAAVPEPSAGEGGHPDGGEA